MIKLYRGFDRKFVPGKLNNVWRESPRVPTQMPVVIHERMDSWFFNRFQVRARSSTIMCSTCLQQASTYAKFGIVMEVIPEPPYKLIFSPSVKDMLDICTEIDSVDHVEDWLSNKEFRLVTDVRDLPNTRGEVMVDCESFFIKSIEV